MKLLNDIFSTGTVQTSEGVSIPVQWHTKEEQCNFIREIVSLTKPSASLEIGLAYGVSTLAILDVLGQQQKPFKHIVADPFQNEFKGIGLSNIERSGYSDHVEFYPNFSDQVIPKLYYDSRKIQLAYIDSTKVFDVLMTDVYFINKILDVNGVIILDDCGFPGIRRLVRFLSQHPSYKIYATFQKDKFSKTRKIARAITFALIKLIPFHSRILSDYNFQTDEELGVDYHCIAFQKTKEDDRNWDWNRTF